MKEQWMIFKDKKTGEELCAYTLRGTFKGEKQATIELLAAENGLPPEEIMTVIEKR